MQIRTNATSKTGLLAVGQQLKEAIKLLHEGRNWQAENVLLAAAEELDKAVHGLAPGIAEK
ncbi:hypothetical protein ABQ366_06815 [Serratia fonticola]|uniref:hypothetical protein n=1 Tax=Serratia fonticola TaxID=47917 RepID=UPI003AAEE83A|nr:hypothetical protein [Serratia fonticola]